MKKNKCSSSCCTYNQTLSEEQEERMEIDMDNNRDFKESSEPVEIIREEVTEVVESDGKTFPLSSIEGHVEEEKNDNLDRYNEDMYEQLTAQSIRLSNLTDMVESLQSQVQQLQETTRLHKRHKTTSVRKKVLVTMVPKQKRRQKEEEAQEAGKNEITVLKIHQIRKVKSIYLGTIA